jgi:hypothetical protein
MTDKKKPSPRGRMSGGPQQDHKPTKKEERRGPERALKYESVPPEERKLGAAQEGVAGVVKTIVVHDERGQIVSVTKISPDAKFGMGVKPQAGQVVKEYEAGTLAEDPFFGPRRE